MQKTISFETRVNELSKIISTFEWDLPHIHNDQLKSFKEEQLRRYKKELEEVLVITKNLENS